MSLTSKFLKAFDPINKSHVEWFSYMIDIAENNPESIIKEINKNPMNIIISDLEVLEFPHVHFVLCASYARAVIKHKAFIP
jgi:hypothetical protein